MSTPLSLTCTSLSFAWPDGTPVFDDLQIAFGPGRTGLVGVNNVALRSLPFLLLTGHRLLAARRYDVVYFSTTMFITLPLGRFWKNLHGIPYVIDLQDPWITDYYERPGAPRPPGGWKYSFAQGLGRLLEGWSMRGVAGLIAVSAAYNGSVQQRYPELARIPAIELPFGSPDPDLAYLRATLSRRPHLLPDGGLRLAFAGALGPGQFVAVELLFAAMAEARREGLPVTVHFFGTSYDPNAQPMTLSIAARHGVADYVHEKPGRLRYFEALQVTLEADANLLFGSTDLDFTPSKLLAVLAAERPLLAIAPAGSAMAARLVRFGQACTTFPGDGIDAVSRAVVVAQLRALSDGKIPATAAPMDGSAQTSARRQMEILAAAS